MEQIMERSAPASSVTIRKPKGQKRKGRHPDKALTTVFVRNVKTPGWYADGNCLYLVVDDNGSKRWTLLLAIKGAARRRQMGLGSTALVPLGEARDLATANRKLARTGIDPVAQRQQQAAGSLAFAQVATEVHESHKGGWRNAKHGAQWLNTLTTYAFPVIGARSIAQIDSADILKVLTPIWLEKPETARRVKQRLKAVLDYAKAAGYRTGDNPVGDIAKGLARQPKRQNHWPALPYTKVPEFIQALRQVDASEIVRLGFEFTILTGGRTNSTRQAEWPEIDIDGALWTVPADHMKGGQVHAIPLPPRCLEILARAKELSDSGKFVFPGRNRDKPLSDGAFTMLLKRMDSERPGYWVDPKMDNRRAVPHGFRSSCDDWAHDRTPFQHEVIEAFLAHTDPNKVTRAYRRGSPIDKLRELAVTWERFACSVPGEVVTLRA